jgi:hypothetical protein
MQLSPTTFIKGRDSCVQPIMKAMTCKIFNTLPIEDDLEMANYLLNWSLNIPLGW